MRHWKFVAVAENYDLVFQLMPAKPKFMPTLAMPTVWHWAWVMLRSMSPEALRYKGLEESLEAVLEWLGTSRLTGR